jgi:hypothetical protein
VATGAAEGGGRRRRVGAAGVGRRVQRILSSGTWVWLGLRLPGTYNFGACRCLTVCCGPVKSGVNMALAGGNQVAVCIHC